MSILKQSYKLRLYCLSVSRVFNDEFLESLSYYIENDEDKDIYLDILDTEFRGNIPQKFLEVVKWVKVEFIEQ